MGLSVVQLSVQSPQAFDTAETAEDAEEDENGRLGYSHPAFSVLFRRAERLPRGVKAPRPQEDRPAGPKIGFGGGLVRIMSTFQLLRWLAVLLAFGAHLGAAASPEVALAFDPKSAHQIEISAPVAGLWEIKTTGIDPFIATLPRRANGRSSWAVTTTPRRCSAEKPPPNRLHFGAPAEKIRPCCSDAFLRRGPHLDYYWLCW